MGFSVSVRLTELLVLWFQPFKLYIKFVTVVHITLLLYIIRASYNKRSLGSTANRHVGIQHFWFPMKFAVLH